MVLNEIIIHTDGGSRGNPGQAAIGVVAESNNRRLFQLGEKIGLTTNNVAEYTAVARSLQELKTRRLQADKISFYLDSELIVKQILGLYRIKDAKLKVLNQQVKDLVLHFRQQGSSVTFTHVLRHLNKEADELLNLALDS